MHSSQTSNPNSIALLASQGWVSLRQFCLIVGVSYPTASKMVKQGKVRCVRVGGINRIYAKEIERFLNEGNLVLPASSEIYEEPTH